MVNVNVCERITVREGEAIKKAATLYKKSAIEYKKRDTTNTTATIGSGEKEIYNQSKETSKRKEGKGNQEEKKRAEGERIPRLKKFMEVTRTTRIKKTIKLTDIQRIERAKRGNRFS